MSDLLIQQLRHDARLLMKCSAPAKAKQLESAANEIHQLQAQNAKLQQELGKSKNEVAELNLAMELISKIARTAPQDTAILEVTNCYRTGELLAQRDLTQQAKGITDALHTWRNCSDSNIRVNMEFEANKLRQQASELNK